ncbi:integumentary mucin C.1 isoform X9 [Ictalurus punctatus]|uniref:Integumentary mucin C.1 isoform X9 n=1 Tax=Ictalurus punctatus TaxID=7998 RepID=A0A9F7QU31_ICTPU|nr:integumentary mucin C.1 isoform X9 [Ictalurus punctatus]
MSDKYNMMHFFTTTSTTTTTTTTTQTSTPEEKPSADLSLVTTPPSTATEEPTAASPVFSTPLITTRHTATPLSTVSTSQTTPKDKSTASPVSISIVNPTSGPKSRSLPTVLSVTGVCVLLAGLMGFCLCVCINKQKTESRCKLNTTHRDQGVMMSVLNMNNSGSEAAETYSVISSVPLPALPLDTSGDIKVDSKITVVDTYHVYSSIPDTHVTTNDAVYSLLQMH